MNHRQETGLFDRIGRPIRIGDIVKLEVDGQFREFIVEYKTVTREVVSHPDFDASTARVAIAGVVFCWGGYDLFPCVDSKGEADTSRMEVIGYVADGIENKLKPGREGALMKRLTWDDWLCGSYAGESAISQTDFDGHKAYYGDAITLLAEYERTGLTPAEIVAMKEDLLKKRQEG